MQKYDEKRLIIMECSSAVLHTDKYITDDELYNAASNGAVLLVNHHGLYYLMCNAALKNYVRNKKQGQRKTAGKIFISSMTMLPPTIADLIFDN